MTVRRSSQRVVRNPLLGLPAAEALIALSAEQRAPLRSLMGDLYAQARAKEAESYRKRKGPMTAYWMAVATYAKHVRQVLA